MSRLSRQALPERFRTPLPFSTVMELSTHERPATCPPDDEVLAPHGGLLMSRLVRPLADRLAMHPDPPRPDARSAHRQGDAGSHRLVSARRGAAPVRAPPDRRPAGGAARRAADPVPERGPRARPRRRRARRGGGRRTRGPLRGSDVVEPRRRRRRLDRGRQGAAAGSAPVRGADQRDAPARGGWGRGDGTRPRRGGDPRRRSRRRRQHARRAAALPAARRGRDR